MNERKIADYLHFYIAGRPKYSIVGSVGGFLCVQTYPHVLYYAGLPEKKLQLHLRPLYTMTVVELRDIFDASYAGDFATETIKKISDSLFELHKLISQKGDFDTISKLCAARFDIFNLINDGLAVDTTK